MSTLLMLNLNIEQSLPMGPHVVPIGWDRGSMSHSPDDVVGDFVAKRHLSSGEKTLNLNTMVVDIKRGIPIEQSLEHSLQLVEVLENAKLLYGRYNERFKLLINSKFRKARMDIMREELIMAVLNPTRVMRYIDMGYDILDDEYLSDFP